MNDCSKRIKSKKAKSIFKENFKPIYNLFLRTKYAKNLKFRL
jgi:hypothetical protein